ncbi:MAG: hypothetical protein Pg6C_08050 [Treponemataceae bacterium]|nr:MAG: hypothetical protein Pg6C_08050 [Treponemataceae bacterium]
MELGILCAKGRMSYADLGRAQPAGLLIRGFLVAHSLYFHYYCAII